MSRSERGAGLFGTVFGIGMFWLLLLVAVQVTYSLYARSVVTSVGYEGARTVAGFDAHEQRGAAAGGVEAEMRSRLGSFGDERVDIAWDLADPDIVRVRLSAELPGFLPEFSPVGKLLRIDRSIEVRTEEFRG